jgi:hypothetical protein
MRFLRFSLRRLLLFTALVAAALYVLILRPPAVARRFAHELEVAAQGDFESVSRQYFGGMRTDEARLEFELRPRRWRDVLRCRQEFEIRMVRPAGQNDLWLVCRREFAVTPIGAHGRGVPVLIMRQGPSKTAQPSEPSRSGTMNRP